MTQIKLMVCLLSVLVILQHYVMADKIDNIRQDIVELKKDFSYDPRDAK